MDTATPWASWLSHETSLPTSLPPVSHRQAGGTNDSAGVWRGVRSQPLCCVRREKSQLPVHDGRGANPHFNENLSQFSS